MPLIFVKNNIEIYFKNNKINLRNNKITNN